mgnify:CR=1 FL=1
MNRLLIATISLNETKAQWFELTNEVIEFIASLTAAFGQIQQAVPSMKAMQCELPITAVQTEEWLSHLTPTQFQEIYTLPENIQLTPASVFDCMVFIEADQATLQANDGTQFVTSLPISKSFWHPNC